MEEQQTGEDEVVRPAGRVADVALHEPAPRMLGRAGAELAVEVHADDLAGRADTLGHQPHRLARPAARVEAPGARPETDPVEQPRARRLPEAGLLAQPLVFLGPTPEHICHLHPATVPGSGPRG